MVGILGTNELFVLFGLAVLVQLYFFLMQRSALELSRAADMDPKDGRQMLPLWYILAWPTTIAKWGLAVLIAVQIHWGFAVAGLVASFLLSALSPIPHGHFFHSFSRTIDKRIARGEDLSLMLQLKSVLKSAHIAMNGDGSSD